MSTFTITLLIGSITLAPALYVLVNTLLKTIQEDFARINTKYQEKRLQLK